MGSDDRNLASLWDMAQAMGEILEDTQELTEQDFLDSRLIRRAVERNFEILGEAAGRISFDFREAHSEIDWRRIVGLRNIIIHRYEEVDPVVLWAIVVDVLPTLLTQIEGLMPPIE
jgi:uncharacterized protein with HEPN domain